MGFPTKLDILSAILEDDDYTWDLPKGMKEKAEYARGALLNADDYPDKYEIQFGRYSEFTFAVYHKDLGIWIDIDGHYHKESPADYTLRRQYKRAEYENKIDTERLLC